MKTRKWKEVKVHDLVIYPTEEYGVLKAEVIEVDVKVVELQPTYHYDYPYGKTAVSGVVRIKYTYNDVTQEVTENLANLVTYTEVTYRELLRAFNAWQAYVNTANSYKAEYLTLMQTRREE